MIKAVKIRLFPNEEQELLMYKSVGIARFAYNWGLNRWNEIYESGDKPNKVNIRTEFNQLKKIEKYQWLKEVSGQVTAYAFEDLNEAFTNFFKGSSNRPQFKSKRKSKQSFYVRYDAIKIKGNTVNIEKIGKVVFKYNKEIPELRKYVNPRCSYDGKYWYLSLGFEQDNNKNVLSNVSVGIDLGIKVLAVASNIDKPIENINKTKTVKKLKKKLKRKQRQVSRKYEMNKQGKKFNKTKNIIKLEKAIKLIHRKLKNISLNHLHQATYMIVKTKPSRVVMETLNIQGIMKNRYLSKAIAQQCFYEFKRQIKYKCEFNGIKFVEADKWYPSSKTCSNCGHIKKVLKLSERTYICEECGSIIDRDLNAAINLSRYSA